jgi:hypothetical protein
MNSLLGVLVFDKAPSEAVHHALVQLVPFEAPFVGIFWAPTDTHNADAGQWTASFEGVPQFAFGGGTAIGAVRRLLEGAESEHGTYTIECFSDLALGEQIPASIVWDPPELLASCPDCNGRGEYIGLLHIEKCRTCGGRMEQCCTAATSRLS